MTVKKARTAKVYFVTTPTGIRLVRAMSQQGAIKHAVLSTHEAHVATQDELIATLGKHEVEDAGSEIEELDV